ncbi:MAG: alpha-E domain-containing protein [Deferribacterales bacterium]
MLSKVANRVYWLARYMERAEDIAKLVNVYTNLMLDMPKGTDIVWYNLITIMGAEETFNEMYQDKTENSVMSFLISDAKNPCSLFGSLCFARENARTTRDILPTEAWEVVNELYLLVKKEKDNLDTRSKRYNFLTSIIKGCQRLEGMLVSGLSRNHTYNFLQIGRLLERADTTTRILDAGSMILSAGQKMKGTEGIVWMNLLKTMNAYQMYRQSVRRRVASSDVIDFLLKDTQFPRAVEYCVDSVGYLASKLPNNDPVQVKTKAVKNLLESFSAKDSSMKNMHDLMDQVQICLYDVDAAVNDTWFNAAIS